MKIAVAENSSIISFLGRNDHRVTFVVPRYHKFLSSVIVLLGIKSYWLPSAACPTHLLGASLRLLLDIGLSTALLCLAGVVLLLVLGLSGLVARDASDSSADGAADAVGGAGAEVGELALGLLLLTLEVLLAARVLERLVATSISVPFTQRKTRSWGEVGGGGGEVEEEALTSEPTRPPTASLALPTVWFHEPADRSGWSLATPVAETVAPGTLTEACEASCSAWALFCLASPWVWSAVLPVREPMALWTVPLTESKAAFRVEVLSLADMLCVGVVFVMVCGEKMLFAFEIRKLEVWL